jgi:membrane-associated phospholipid phosphatase
VTAIRQADLDGNSATTADAAWQSLIATPPFPEYTSGHSTFSATAATILGELIGDNVGFSTTSIGLPGVTRSYTSFQQAAQEAGMSRIYGGIHFMSANTNGLECGEKIGNYVIDNLMQSRTSY